jgi:hypothetical protein
VGGEGEWGREREREREQAKIGIFAPQKLAGTTPQTSSLSWRVPV